MRDYTRILQQVMCEPWCIMPTAHEAIRKILQSRLMAESTTDVPQRPPGRDACGNEVAVESMQIADGLAVIPIGGVMARHVPQFSRGSGVVDVEDVMNDLTIATASNDVSTILLNMDTPGGTVEGTPELAAKIDASAQRKGVYAYTSGMMCSAGIWTGTKASAVFASPSATLGSIGVYMPWIDSSAYLARQGVKVDVISSGPFKGMGEPGTSLSPEQRQLLQDRVNGLAEEFQVSVALSRPGFDSVNMRGQVFTGKESLSIGLVDGLFNSFSDVVNAIGFDSRAFVKKPQKAEK